MARPRYALTGAGRELLEIRHCAERLALAYQAIVPAPKHDVRLSHTAFAKLREADRQALREAGFIVEGFVSATHAHEPNQGRYFIKLEGGARYELIH